MRRARTSALLVPVLCAALFLLSAPARAQFTNTVDCIADDTALQTLLGSNTYQGGSLDIKGTCLGDVTIAITTSMTGDAMEGGAVNGQIQVYGSGFICTNMVLNGTTGLNEAAVWVHEDAAAILQNCSITHADADGIYVERQSSLFVFGGSIVNTGCGTGAAPNNNGIEASDGATVTLGESNSSDTGSTPNSSNAVTISGSCGDNLHVSGGSNLHAFDANIVNSSHNEVYVSDNSTARFLGGSIVGQKETAAWAMQAVRGSSLHLEQINEPPGTLNVANGGIFVSRNSTLEMNNTSLSQENASGAVIEASYDSSVVLAGCNDISAASGGTAIGIDHSSSLAQLFGSSCSGTALAGDAITGAGLVQEQSSMDIGVGLVASSPSIIWTGNISAEQNSSFRLSGGVHITGAVLLEQGSNGFFNLANGGANNVDSGVSCPFTTMPASHVSAPQKVTPNVTVAASLASAASPQCLPF
ncbi:MAG TPA: hypothetical protein VLV50_15835 [Stellaceae bacterium]|nr:hypothetical protein [Stellaceae bacterium]